MFEYRNCMGLFTVASNRLYPWSFGNLTLCWWNWFIFYSMIYRFLQWWSSIVNSYITNCKNTKKDIQRCHSWYLKLQYPFHIFTEYVNIHICTYYTFPHESVSHIHWVSLFSLYVYIGYHIPKFHNDIEKKHWVTYYSLSHIHFFFIIPYYFSIG